MQANSWWRHNNSICCILLWIQESWKRRWRNTKLEYLENKKTFLREMKSIFHHFWRALCYNTNIQSGKIENTTFKARGSFSLLSFWLESFWLGQSCWSFWRYCLKRHVWTRCLCCCCCWILWVGPGWNLCLNNYHKYS